MTSEPIPLDDAGVSTATLETINARFERGSDRMDRLETAMEVNTQMTADVHEVLMAARSGIAAIGKFGRGLARVGNWLRKLLIWVTPPLAALGVFWQDVKHWLHIGGQ